MAKCSTNAITLMDKYPDLIDIVVPGKLHTPLMLAIKSYNNVIIDYLLVCGANTSLINIYCNTALHHAIIMGKNI